MYNTSKLNLCEVLLPMGGLGVLLFAPAYWLLQKSWIDYKSLLLFEGLFFANPHLASTYLRAYSDSAEAKRYENTLYLLVFLFAGISAFISILGLSWLWVLGSVYFYWQWWHHARQSFGLGRKYQRELKQLLPLDLNLNDVALWTCALIGIILKSNAAHDYYEGIPIKVLHLPEVFSLSFLVVAAGYLVVYLGRQVYLFLAQKTFQAAFLTHWTLQSFVFICFFGLLPTDLGIIAASFWHCTQYITHVKAHQEVKVQKGFLQEPLWLSIYAKENWLIYFVFLFTTSLAIPFLKLQISSLNITAVIFGLSMAITFHHYLVDAIVWTKEEVAWSFTKKSDKPSSVQSVIVDSKLPLFFQSNSET